MKKIAYNRRPALCVLAFVICFTLSGCSYLNEYLGLEDDNIYEESVEGAIKYKTGFDLDLTPRSKEQ